MYALLAFTISGSAYFFITKNWKWWVMFSTAAIYTHHFGLFSLFGQGIWMVGEITVFHRRKKIFKAMSSFWPFAMVGLLYVPWVYPMYLQTSRVQGAGFWLSVPTIKEGLNLLYRFVIGGVRQEYQTYLWILAGALLIGKDWRTIWKKWLKILVVFLTPVFLAWGASYLITPVFYDRYLLSVLVGMTVLLGLGTRKWAIPVLAILLGFYGWGSYQEFIHPAKRPFRELANYVKAEKKDEDYLLNLNGKAHHIWESQYYGIGAPIYTPDGPLPLYVGTAQMKPEDTIERLPEIKGRLGTIASEPPTTISLPGWRQTDVVKFGDLNFIWWEKVL